MVLGEKMTEEMNKLRPIQSEFKINGYYYKLMNRVGDLALYSQHRMNTTTKPIGYEIHKIRTQKVPLLWAKKEGSYKGYTHFERLASDEDFGEYGWSFVTLEQAHAFFSELRWDKAGKTPDSVSGTSTLPKEDMPFTTILPSIQNETQEMV